MARPDAQLQNAIAIVGMAGQYADAADLPAYWARLRRGAPIGTGPVQLIFLKPPQIDAHTGAKPTSIFAAHALAACESALDQWGRDGVSRSSRVGLWVAQNMRCTRALADQDTGKLVHRSLAGALAQFLDCRGAVLDVDTECSSVAVAVHAATCALLTETCDAAIVCAVNVGLDMQLARLLSSHHGEDHDGQAIRQHATVPSLLYESGWRQSEAAGAIVLRLRAHAARDHDPIHAVIRAVECGHCGTPRAIGGNLDALCDLIRRALENAAVAPEAVTHVELDYLTNNPSAVSSLMKLVAFGTCLDDGRCHPSLSITADSVGDIKSAIGLASLQKGVLSIMHRCVPPTVTPDRYLASVNVGAPHFRMPENAEEQPTAPGQHVWCLGAYGGTGVCGVIVLSDDTCP